MCIKFWDTQLRPRRSTGVSGWPFLASSPRRYHIRLFPLSHRRSMDEREFRRLLHLFPPVRSRTYCQAEAASSSGTAQSVTEEKTRAVKNDQKIDAEDPFWQKLKTTAERKVGPNKAEQFVKAFRDAHQKLVYKNLSIDAAESFIKTARK